MIKFLAKPRYSYIELFGMVLFALTLVDNNLLLATIIAFMTIGLSLFAKWLCKI